MDITVTPSDRPDWISACYGGSAMGVEAVDAFLADGNTGEAIHYLTDEHIADLAVRTPRQAVVYCRRVLLDATRGEALAEAYANQG